MQLYCFSMDDLPFFLIECGMMMTISSLPCQLPLDGIHLIGIADRSLTESARMKKWVFIRSFVMNLPKLVSELSVITRVSTAV